MEHTVRIIIDSPSYISCSLMGERLEKVVDVQLHTGINPDYSHYCIRG